MANWYYTQFTLEGDEADVDAVRTLLSGLPVDSDGELLLDYIATALGCDPELTFCAGYISADTLSISTGRIDFATWTKWQPPYQIIYALCRCYASLRYYFMAFLEEYCTNDAEGRFYPERMYVELSEGNRIEERGFLTIGEALAWIGESTGCYFASEEEVKQHFNALDDHDSSCTIHHVYVIDETEQLTFLTQEDSPNLLLFAPDGTRVGELQVTYSSGASTK